MDLDVSHSEDLTRDELAALVRRVFAPRPEDTGLAVLIDLPDERVPDDEEWADRRRTAAAWVAELRRSDLGLPVALYSYWNVRLDNADLPDLAWRLESVLDDGVLDSAKSVAFDDVFRGHSILMAPTRFSATAPLKLAARRYGFRAATMPGFTREMIPALRLDYEEVDRRVRRLAALLDEATGADFLFEFEARGRGSAELHLDLRFRAAHASSGLAREPGEAWNLPSGESFIVPYEGENEGEPSRSHGTLPVELDGEVVCYVIRENRAVDADDGGPVARREKELLRAEPAYGNLAELGLGVLADFGVQPIGKVLLDEKLGLHIAFGRSDHFGGRVGAADFSRPDAVVHVDRVYLPETQPRVLVRRVDLTIGGEPRPLMGDGSYVEDLHSSGSPL
jgi:hypothetical protein